MTRQIFFCFLMTTIFLACNSQTEKDSSKTYYDSSIIVDRNNIPLDSNQFYFPVVLFPEYDFISKKQENGKDTFLVKLYSQQLFALKEPLLFNKKLDKEIYRFTWLRTFHHPISIRIEKNGEDYTLSWHQCNGAGGYYPGKLTVNKEKDVNEEVWNEFKSKIKKINFWNIESGAGSSRGLDGAEWILEGSKSNGYNVVVCWSPNGGDFYDCCNYLIELTDLKIKSDEKY